MSDLTFVHKFSRNIICTVRVPDEKPSSGRQADLNFEWVGRPKPKHIGRERALRDLIRKRQKPIALFIDDAHDLHSKTLIGLKRLIEVVRDSCGTLSVVLAGHPKLKNDLRRPSMEEIGSRATIFELEGLGSEKRKYIKWLLVQSRANVQNRSQLHTARTPEEGKFSIQSSMRECASERPWFQPINIFGKHIVDHIRSRLEHFYQDRPDEHAGSRRLVTERRKESGLVRYLPL